jgi:hypothetical protein
MEIPRFETRNVNPRLATADIGDAFQGFVHELLLPEHPQLHRFPGGGKDGGIDLIETSDTCLVVECKVVGDDDYTQIEQRWNTVKGHLEEHLSDARGPTKGQSQYSPWYSTDTPIAEYVFSVSAAFANEQQRRDFGKTITDFFHGLAERRPHLSHLAALKVSIIDWNDLRERLRKRPHSIFRWFPSSRPNGLLPLDETVDVGAFRAYLNNAKLPYYSLAEHLRTTPATDGFPILNEESLFASFDRPDITGLVITGKGGIGKSRLTLELGWKALGEGWTVMRVQRRLKDDALEELAEKLTPETPVLLLVDYIETQSDFVELVESLNLLNDSGVTRIRYVAACRTGYYHHAIAASGRHLPIDLSPPPGAVALGWFAQYRSETVRRILAKAGIAVTKQHVTICRDLPILAVFLAYLHTSGRTEDLAELLSETEFGRWVARRVQLTFPAKDVSRELALLVPLFPMADAAAAQLHPERLRPIFDRLATDGWIERVTASVLGSFDEWVTAHDVLADQILLSYLRSIPNTADAFIAELLSLAAELGCLASAVVALQRIADSPPLNALPWANIITNGIAADEIGWRNARDLLIRTTLLAVPDRLALLHAHKGLWVDAERDIGFQNALGWFARWTAAADDGSIPELHKQDLIAWILKAAPFAERSNYVITWGLRLAPAAVQDIGLRWITTRPNLFQTHYLMVAWLECGLPTQSIALPVQRWCQKFSKTSHLSFVAPAWLDAGGDPALVQEGIKDWLGEHKTDAEARFVYKAWLDAKGDTALVQDAIKDWLGEHKTDAEASHVYKAWLDAKGDPALVQDAIKDWLGEHKTDLEAQFVYNAWLDADGERDVVWDALLIWLAKYRTDETAVYITKFVARQPNLPAATIRDVLAWCRTFPTNDDVLWRLTQLGKNLFVVGAEEDVVSTSEVVLANLLLPTTHPDSVTRGQVTTLISRLLTVIKSSPLPLQDRVDSMFVRWLRHPLSFGIDPMPYLNIQQVAFVRRLQLLIDAVVIEVTDDREALRRFMVWLDAWDVKRKQRVLPILDDLKERYPAPGLWDIVQFGK